MYMYLFQTTHKGLLLSNSATVTMTAIDEGPGDTDPTKYPWMYCVKVSWAATKTAIFRPSQTLLKKTARLEKFSHT